MALTRPVRKKGPDRVNLLLADLVAAVMQRQRGWCQTNANQSLFALPAPSSGSKKTAPLGQSSGAVQLEILSAVEGAFLIEMVVD